MESLPADIINIIIKKLDLVSIVKLSLANKFIYSFIAKLKIIEQLFKVLPIFHEKNPKINPVNNILIEACAKGYFELVEHLAKNEICIGEVVDETEDPNLKYYHCALRMSIEYNHMDIIKFFIEYFQCDIPRLVIDIGDPDLIKLTFEENISSKNKMATYDTYLVEQYFSGITNFGRRVSCDILRNGSVAQEIYLKIILPFDLESVGPSGQFKLSLPQGETILLKKNFIYSLISDIEIEIGGSLIACYDSDELYKIDKINKIDEKIIYLSKFKKNTIYYPINIQSIFCDIISISDNICRYCSYEKHYNLKMHGLKLSHLKFNIFKIHVKFGTMLDLVDPSYVAHNKLLGTMDGIALEDASLLVRCINYHFNHHTPYYDTPKCDLVQKINIWIKEEIHLELNTRNEYIELERYARARNENRYIANLINQINQINQMILFIKISDHPKIINYYLKIANSGYIKNNKLTIIKSIYDSDSNCQLIYLDMASIKLEPNSRIYLKLEFGSGFQSDNSMCFECLLNIDLVGRYNQGRFSTYYLNYLIYDKCMINL
jgi:hypothetical protein